MSSRVSKSGRPAISTLDTFWPSYEGRTSLTCGAVLAGGFGCGSGGLLVGGCWAASWAMAGESNSATVRHAIAHPRKKPAMLESRLGRELPATPKTRNVQENITCGEMTFCNNVFDALASCSPVHPAKTRQQLARCTRRLQFTALSGVLQRVLGNHVNCHRIIASSAVLRPAVRLLGAPFRLKGENMKRFAALAVSLVLLCSASLFAQDVVRLG